MPWTELDNPERPVAGDEPPEDVRAEVEAVWPDVQKFVAIRTKKFGARWLAEDALGRIALRLLRVSGRWDRGRATFKTFALAHAGFELRDCFREIRRASGGHGFGRSGDHPSILSLDGPSDKAETWADRAVDTSDPFDNVTSRDTVERLAKCAGGDSWVVREVYLEGRTQSQVAKAAGYSVSRISQLHDRAIGRIRDALAGEEASVAGIELDGELRARWAALRAEKERRRAAHLTDETVPPERTTELLGDEKGGATAWERAHAAKRQEAAREERSKVRTNTTTIPKCEKCGQTKTSCAGGKWFRCFACSPAGPKPGSNGKAGHDGASLTTRREPEPAPEPEPVAVEVEAGPVLTMDGLDKLRALARECESDELEPEPPVRRFVIPTIPDFVVLERDVDDQVVRLARALRALDPVVRRAVLAFAVAYEEDR
jgi:RNA polymerase sigma factor (sigma-70 family)